MKRWRYRLGAILLGAFLLFHSTPVMAAGETTQAAKKTDAEVVLEYINKLRQLAGVAPVTYSEKLAAAAQGHADYMLATGHYGHQARPGDPLFFGVNPWDRAKAHGYYGVVSEDINAISHPKAVVDDWMSAPYHRWPILSPLIDEIGFGSADDYAVLQMGHGSRGVDDWVVWPYEGQQNVPIVWWGYEMPDPLRLHPGVEAPVGAVITLQYGRNVSSLLVDEASLKTRDGKEVEILLNSPATDDQLTHQAFVIPVRYLDYDTEYQVQMSGTVRVDGERKAFTKSWSFRTEKDPNPVIPPYIPPVSPVEPPVSEEPDPPAEPGTPPADPPKPPKEPPVVDWSRVNLTDIEGHWAKQQIGRLVMDGVVNGYPDNTFRPNDTLTHAAFIKMLAAALDLPLQPGFTQGATGVVEKHWVVRDGYAGALLKADILTPSELWTLDEPISRKEIASLIFRCTSLKAIDEERTDGRFIAQGGKLIFTDVNSWGYNANVIRAAIEAGLITGYSEADGTYTFRPDGQATRAEASVMVIRLLDHLDR